MHVYLLIWLASGHADVHALRMCTTHPPWLWPFLCTHVIGVCTYSYSLALASPMYMRFACVPTHTAWLWPRLCTCARCVYLLVRLGSCLAYVHALRTSTYLYGFAPASPMHAYAMREYLLIWFGPCLAYVHALCMCTYSYSLALASPMYMCYARLLTCTAWLRPRLCRHALCMCTYLYGLAPASPM